MKTIITSLPSLTISLLISIYSFLPQNVFALDKNIQVEKAIELAFESAELIADSVVDKSIDHGRRLMVPEQYASIQSALDEANAGDIVVVMPGIYYESIFVRDGVRLVSYAGDDGNLLEKVEGAFTKLPRRTLRTIIDGSKDHFSNIGMINFSSGAGRNTVVDGFTIQNLTKEDHHVPGHSHAVNLRGSSPVVMNCYVVSNGSTGIGNHVIYLDENKAISQRDFRFDNVEHKASAVIYRNIIANNLGRGIGCNHFSTALVLGNEVFGNDDSALPGKPGPGIGLKHGAAPTVVGNIVHHNPYGGIGGKRGVNQGLHPVNFPPRPIIRNNVVFLNGESAPNISCNNCGTEEQPFTIEGNFVFESANVSINVANNSVGVMTDNLVKGPSKVGIAIRSSKISKLSGNVVLGANENSFLITPDSEIGLVQNNEPAVFHPDKDSK